MVFGILLILIIDSVDSWGILHDVATPVVVVQHRAKHQESFFQHHRSSYQLLQRPSWQEFLLPSAHAEESMPPTNEQVLLLRSAFSEMYGSKSQPNNYLKANELLTQAIAAWSSADERAALYRVRGDSYMALQQIPKAIEDYSTTLDILSSSFEAREAADPAELPAA